MEAIVSENHWKGRWWLISPSMKTHRPIGKRSCYVSCSVRFTGNPVPTDFIKEEQMVYCSATISRFATHDSWWYTGCPRCYRELKQQEHKNQLGCSQHGIQQIIPWFRVYMTIEDGDHEATVIIMGKQAEHLFGSTCKDLVTKRSYPTAETLPQEIEKTIGQKLLFQIKVKETSELIVKAVFPDVKLLTPPPQKDPATATPDHPPFERKRLIEKGRKELFISEREKKPKSGREAEKGGTTSSSSTREKKDN